jgi:thiol-disulfide isomerase/thioredoxin
MKCVTALLLLLVVLTAKAQTLKPFTITGDIGSLKEKIDTIRLSYTTDGKNYDQAFPVKNGRFISRGKISQPTVAMIYYFASTDTVRIKYRSTVTTSGRIFIQPGTMNFKSGSSISDNTLTGSPFDKDFKEMERKTRDHGIIWGKEFESVWLEKDSILRLHLVNTMMDSSRVFPVKIWLPYLESHPQSPLVFYGITEMMRFNHNFQGHDIAPLYDRLTPGMKNSYEGKRLKAMIATGNGSLAPEFSQADTSGVMVSLSSFRGKYVLLDFWGSWCNFCRKENPNLIQNFEKYKEKGFTIISIAADDDKKKWMEAIHKDHVGRWTHLSDLKGQNNEVSKLYFINGYPSNFLVDPNGKIIAQNLRGEVLDKKLAELFK